MHNKDLILYKIIRVIVSFLVKIVYRPKVIGKEYLKKDGAYLLAGNHTHNFDSLLLMSAVKREIHFLAKQELFDGKFGFFYKRMGLIPVDRSKKNPDALNASYEYLNNGLVVGIFPEGTTEKGRGLLEFKMGAVKMANKTDKEIIPFVITGKYKIFNNTLQIKFLKPYKVSDDLEKENNILRNKILEEMK